MGFGIALLGNIWWLTLIYTLVFWLYYERIIFAEEAYLREKFGVVFLEWANKTPVFIPKTKKYIKSNIKFSVRNVLRREYNGFFAVIVVMFIFETIGEVSAEGWPEFDLAWIMLLIIGFIVWLILRTLKKHTTILNVEGR